MIKLKSILKEIGEGMIPYKWTGPEDDFGSVNYFFKTEDDDYYNIIFGASGEGENDWSLNFYVKNDTDIDTWSSGAVTNKGRQFKIISTIMDIMKDFINEYPADKIFFTGSDKEGSKINSNQRDMLYTAYVKKNINKLQGWDFEIQPGGGMMLFRKEPLPSMSMKFSG